MTLRVLAACLLAASLGACVPKEADPNISDLDGDGVFDAWDKCMADPEDFDGFEDEDGCAEEGSGSEGPATTGEQSDSANTADATSTDKATPTVKTTKKRIARSKAKPLAKRSVEASVANYQGTAWGAHVDQDERGAVIFGFGKAWISGGKKNKKIKGDVYRASFSPDGRHVALVAAREFLIFDVARGKKVRSFPYAKGTSGFPETKLIRLKDDGSVMFFDGCQLHRAKLDSKRSTALGEPQCGDRPLASENGSRWYGWRQLEDEQVTVQEFNTQTGERSPVLGGSGSAPGLSLLLVSPDGKHLCYSRHKDGSEFTCRNVDSAIDLEIWKGPTDTRATFSADGMLGFGAGPLRGERKFFAADLSSRKLRLLGSLGRKEEWINAVGTSGFIASGGKRLLHFDLASKEQVEITLGEGEWEGFAAIPGKPSEFIVGKERRATRDLFRVSVP